MKIKAKAKLNKEWHFKNKMPEKATEKQRAKWHKAHMECCACRTPSDKILELIKNYT